MTSNTDVSGWDESQMIRVGWLKPGENYRQGEVSEGFVDKLIALLINPWEPATAAGWHDCGFCQLSTGPRTLRYKETTVQLGITNLFVPGDSVIYVAPSLIAHYIDAHGYSPPDEFQAAVIACPEMRSMANLTSILANGPKGYASTGV